VEHDCDFSLRVVLEKIHVEFEGIFKTSYYMRDEVGLHFTEIDEFEPVRFQDIELGAEHWREDQKSCEDLANDNQEPEH